eukprot:gnl/MRDRNA2_/MRDRNA2_101813_c0_seq1.p1 gnl/MRDRNA2_/MRDRNA2_101813_c0~~gnl/MRDRNA2_/MRDRNA2_101813_c0_seq1.p1  ORF type:complete len:298 (+),score=69.52 gnl/MRDRNA2_/MRDRNA2_101813_c0_seq1:44-895(+)
MADAVKEDQQGLPGKSRCSTKLKIAISCCTCGVVGVVIVIVLMVTGALTGMVAEEDDSTFTASYSGNLTDADELTKRAMENSKPKSELYNSQCRMQAPDVAMYFTMIFDRVNPDDGCLTSALSCVGTKDKDDCGKVNISSCDEFRNQCAIRHWDDIIVNVEGVQSRKGTLRLGVASSKEEWNRGEVDWPKVATNTTIAPAECGNGCMVQMMVKDVKWGANAFVVLHDENDDMEMDTTWYGKPDEGMLASNDAEGGVSGGPKWGDAAFLHVGGPTEQTIDIWYP